MSRFSGMREAREAREAERLEQAPPPEPVSPAPEPPRRGRPATGKRSNPDYESVNTYMRRDLHQRLRVRSVMERRDLADIIEEALLQWEARQPGESAKR